MAIDLATIPDASPPGTTLEIPLNTDPCPYQDLQAQGRYPQQATPDTLPNMLATMAAITNDGSNTGQTLWTDGQHRLLVNTGASASGGLGPQGWMSHDVSSLDFSVAANSLTEVSGTGRTYVLGVGVTLRPDVGATPAGAGIVDFAFIKGFGDVSIFCNFCQLAVDVAHNANSTVQSVQIMFPVPLSIVAAPYVVYRVTNGLGYAIRCSIQSIFV